MEDTLYSLQESIDVLILPKRFLNTLERNDIYTIEDLKNRGLEYLFNIRQLGRVGFNLIKEEYKRYTGEDLPLEETVLENSYTEVKNDSNSGKNLTSTTPIVKKHYIKVTLKDFDSYTNTGADYYLKSILPSDTFLDQIQLPQRTINALKRKNIHTVGEITNIPIYKIYRLKGIGTVSLFEISNKLMEKISGQEQATNRNLVVKLLSRLSDKRERDIITRRYGLITGEKKTLEEIGEDYNLTRERIRQIETRAILKLKHPRLLVKSEIKNTIEQIILKEGGVISDIEADQLLSAIIKNDNLDGSSFLDLIANLNWIDREEVGEVNLYAPRYNNLDFSFIVNKIYKLLKESINPLSIESLNDTLKIPTSINLSTNHIDSKKFTTKLCKIYPHIEEVHNGIFTTYSKRVSTTIYWVNLMREILEKENSPLHFTELSNKVNEICRPGVNLDSRRAHSLLIEQPIFAHIGVRGTYGLVEWGIRKEPTLFIAEESIKKAGFPLHWRQILNYVGKYKNTSKANVLALLQLSGKFIQVGDGTYDVNRS